MLDSNEIRNFYFLNYAWYFTETTSLGQAAKTAKKRFETAAGISFDEIGIYNIFLNERYFPDLCAYFEFLAGLKTISRIGNIILFLELIIPELAIQFWHYSGIGYSGIIPEITILEILAIWLSRFSWIFKIFKIPEKSKKFPVVFIKINEIRSFY
jgi:hypothetical protein